MSFESSNSARSVQSSFFDLFDNLNEKTRKSIINSKFGVFRSVVYPNIDVESYKVLYSDSGRSPTTVRDMVMAMILQGEENLTVDALIMRLDTDIAFRYVLGTTGSCVDSTISRSNFFAFVARVVDYESKTGINLVKETVKKLSLQVGREMG